MAFVNEYIPQEDFEKYDFKTINGFSNPAGYWVIDRDREIWLRKFDEERTFDEFGDWRGGMSGKRTWNFYWKGVLMKVITQRITFTGGGIDEPCWIKLKLLSINLPENLKTQRTIILKDLEKAFVGYREEGIFSESSSFSLTFDTSEIKGE